jgi:hypothetical protein
MVPGAPDAGADDARLLPEPEDRSPQLRPEVAEIAAAAVRQFDPLEVAPDALVGVRLGGVGGEVFQPQPGGGAGGEEGLDHPSPVDGRAVPEHEQRAPDALEQVPQEADNIRAATAPGRAGRACPPA